MKLDNRSFPMENFRIPDPYNNSQRSTSVTSLKYLPRGVTGESVGWEVLVQQEDNLHRIVVQVHTVLFTSRQKTVSLCIGYWTADCVLQTSFGSLE